MEKPRITQIVSHDMAQTRVDVLTISNTVDAHTSVVSALLDLGLDEGSALEFDADYSESDVDVLKVSKDTTAHLITQESQVLLILETSMAKSELINVLEKHFKVLEPKGGRRPSSGKTPAHG